MIKSELISSFDVDLRWYNQYKSSNIESDTLDMLKELKRELEELKKTYESNIKLKYRI